MNLHVILSEAKNLAILAKDLEYRQILGDNGIYASLGGLMKNTLSLR